MNPSVHAFIFTSLADLPGARALAEDRREVGWQVTVALDFLEQPERLLPGEIVTTFPRRGKLNGSDCVSGILQTMRASTARVLVKLDADMRLTPAGGTWLMNASDGPRGFTLGSSPWIGAWALPSAALPHAIRKSFSAGICRTCGESKISHWILRRLGTNPAVAPPRAVQVWRTGRPLHPDAFLLTLPSFLSPAARAAELTALHDPELL